jgi:hypothetical protein
VEVKIGVENSARELAIESAQTPEEVEQQVRKALAEGSDILTLVDEKGRRIIVPAAKVAYVEIAEAEGRRVGFIAS